MDDSVKNYIIEIIKLMQDRDEINAGIKMLYNDAKTGGIDIRALREVIKMLSMDEDEVESRLESIERYWELARGTSS